LKAQGVPIGKAVAGKLKVGIDIFWEGAGTKEKGKQSSQTKIKFWEEVFPILSPKPILTELKLRR